MEQNWLEKQCMRVRSEMRKSTKSLGDILNELGYSEEEKQKIRWGFIE